MKRKIIFVNIILYTFEIISFCNVAANSSDSDSTNMVDLNKEFKNSPIISLASVEGMETILPCNLTSPHKFDVIQLVLWYRDGFPTPIYSYDARGKFRVASKWASPSLLRGRSSFKISGHRGFLFFNGTEESDESVYRCRVDFKKHTTSHFRVNLTVIEPIQRIEIETFNETIAKGTAGPFMVGERPSIICKVYGGDPLPSATWWKNSNLLKVKTTQFMANISASGSIQEESDSLESFAYMMEDDNSEPYVITTQIHHIAERNLKKYDYKDSSTKRTEIRVISSTISLPPLQREDFRSTFTCRAFNHQKAATMEASVRLDMHFGPVSVKIRGLKDPVPSGELIRLTCESIGGRPPPTLLWYLDGHLIKNKILQTTSLDGNATTSSLKLNPRASDDGKKVTCRADNKIHQSSVIENTEKLKVLYAPQVRISEGTSLNLNSIKEGDDVYFDCYVHARPKAPKIQWKYNGDPIFQKANKRVMLVGKSLVLQKISRNQSGLYSCQATNELGTTESNEIQLSIKYAPVCMAQKSNVYGVDKNDITTVTCHVESDPPVSNYNWAFNKTGQFMDIPNSQFNMTLTEKHHQRSDLRYSPASDLDYGTLLCWARNSVGVQKVPCIFTVFPAGTPDMLLVCKQVNNTETSVIISCTAGYSGGMNQTFVAEAWDEGLLRATDRRLAPLLKVNGLRPGTRYTLKVFAENSLGRSTPLVFTAFTLTDVAERRTALNSGEQKEFFISPIIIGVVAGSLSCMALIIFVGLLIAWTKWKKRQLMTRISPSKEVGWLFIFQKGGRNGECLRV